MIISYTVPEIWHVTYVIVIFYFGLFFPLLPPNSQKKWKFQKKLKNAWRYIILHNCTKNYDYRLYCSWDMVCDRCYFCFILGYFLPFYPLTAQKIKISKKWKNRLEISSFYMCVPKIMIRWCMVPEIWCATDGRTDGRI